MSAPKINMYVDRHGGEAFVLAVLTGGTRDIYYVSFSDYINGYTQWSDHEYKMAINRLVQLLATPSDLIHHQRVNYGFEKKTWLDEQIKGRKLFQIECPHAGVVMNLLIQYQKAKDALKVSFDYNAI